MKITLEGFNSLDQFCKYDNLDSANFIQFYFDFNSKSLNQFVLISLDAECITFNEDININIMNLDYYRVSLDRLTEKEHRTNFSVKAIKSLDELCIEMGNDSLSYYRVAENTYVGVNSKQEIKGVYLNGLTKENIKNILGE